MKNLSLTLLILLITSTSYAQTYTLKGDVKNLQSDSLFILKYNGSNLSGAKISVTQGKFEYTDSVAEPYFIQILKLKPGTNSTEGKVIEFMVEPGVMQITGDASSFEHMKVSGSKSDEVLKKYLLEDEKLKNHWEALKISYDHAVAKKDLINKKKIGIELNAVLLKKRVPLLKQYVKANAKTTIGALLPNFCILEDALKKEDYKEMYEMLDLKIRKTGYGQRVLARCK
ncbi:DUF4369 domain-containing protein [Pedobacter gandavensis]|uniref:DUF4369 domain-containing protein n=1 Tax=Pedobacter gandavensis TaxID=2679963 RepID=A0ABR6EZ55_9SPHI|nr:DUF4369 domain-containing protein [Pedobacter gandavensis]MBB2150546.1 DUF4369 domain-containing protein [Pedobacter gandavensis]